MDFRSEHVDPQPHGFEVRRWGRPPHNLEEYRQVLTSRHIDLGQDTLADGDLTGRSNESRQRWGYAKQDKHIRPILIYIIYCNLNFKWVWPFWVGSYSPITTWGSPQLVRGQPSWPSLTTEEANPGHSAYWTISVHVPTLHGSYHLRQNQWESDTFR